MALWNHATYLFGDSYQYLRGGLTFSKGLGLQDMSGSPFVFLGPLYAISIGIIYRVLPGMSVETAARLCSLGGATVAVVAFYQLVRWRYSQTVAILSAMLFALLPLRVWSGQWILTNGLALGLALSGIAVLFRKEKPIPIHALVAGILIGLAYLTRSDALVFSLGAFAYVLIFAKSRSLPARLNASLLFLFGFACLALPYHLWLHSNTGAWTTTATAFNLDASEALYQGAPSPLAGWHFDQNLATFVSHTPDLSLHALWTRYIYFAQIEIARLRYLIGPWFLTLPLVLVGGIRFLIALGKRRIDAFWQTLLLSLLFVLPLFHVEDRYLLPALPVLCLWLVDGASTIGKWIGRYWPQRFPALSPAWISTTLVLLILGSYGYRLATLLPAVNSQNLAKDVAVWMQAENLPEGKIMAQEPAVAFHRSATHVWLPDGSVEQVIRYARQRDVRYVFVSSRDLNMLQKNLLPDNQSLPIGLVALRRFEEHGVTARLFELTP
jgi:4-amino-4-deoxy-L-arabinose transferase-like glycosyltransferase